MMQMYNLLFISLAPDSPAIKLIEDEIFAGGVVGGRPQAWALLEARYYVVPPPPSPADLMTALVNKKWPKEVSREVWQLHSTAIFAEADTLAVFPQGDTPPEQKTRALWFRAIGEPPEHSPWFDIHEKARLSCGPNAVPSSGIATIAHLRAFVASVDEQLSRRGAAPKRALIAETLAQQCTSCQNDDEPNTAPGGRDAFSFARNFPAVSYTHLRAHET